MTPSPEPPVVISSAAQHRALAHPLRHRLLLTLGRESATISRLAATLGVGKGTIAYHLRVLHDAGLVRVAELRQVRGGTEVHYRRTGGIQVDGYHPAGGESLLYAVSQEMAASPDDPFVLLRSIRLTDAAAARLRATLTDLLWDDALTDAAEPPEPGTPRHTVLVTMYQVDES